MAREFTGNPHVVNQIVDRGLCVRCGACEPACPVNIVRFNEHAYPYITDEKQCIATCTRCLKACPGENVNFSDWDEKMFGSQPHAESITGIARRALVSFATDEGVRKGGASGGFVTQILLYMLDKQLIDGALVLGSSVDGHGWRQSPFIARTAEDLRRAAKSKYMATPFLKPLAEMEQIDGRYAVVGLPCYIHGLKKYQRVSKKLRERVKLTIGLYCNVEFEPYVVDDLILFNNIKKENVTNVDFRHGSWPGGIVAQLRDGHTKKMLKLEDWKDEFNLLKLFYTPARCNMCIDFSAEYADLAVGDPWLRGRDGKYLFEDGRTTVLVRTESGEQIVRQAVTDGYLHVEDIPLKTFMITFEKVANHKRNFVPKNLMLRKLLGLPTPQYHRPIGSRKVSGFASMLGRSAILALAKFKSFRRCGLFLAQTRLAVAVFAWNRKRKEKNFSAAYPKLEKFVDRLLQ